MNNSLKARQVIRAMSYSPSAIALLLLSCGALAAQTEEHRVRNIVLVHGCLGRWFRLEGCLRHSCQGPLQREHRPRAGDVL